MVRIWLHNSIFREYIIIHQSIDKKKWREISTNFRKVARLQTNCSAIIDAKNVNKHRKLPKSNLFLRYFLQKILYNLQNCYEILLIKMSDSNSALKTEVPDVLINSTGGEIFNEAEVIYLFKIIFFNFTIKFLLILVRFDRYMYKLYSFIVLVH